MQSTVVRVRGHKVEMEFGAAEEEEISQGMQRMIPGSNDNKTNEAPQFWLCLV